MPRQPITLTRHIIMEQRAHPDATGELSTLIAQIGLATKMIAREMGSIGLGQFRGETGEVNVQGEEVKRLDQFANDTFVHAFGHSGLVCTLVSEEMEKPLHLSENCGRAKYTLLFDPIDGSSNIDVNGVVGTIFSIYRRGDDPNHVAPEGIFRRGREQVAAGYVMYGPSTILVYAARQGVHVFTLDAGIGEYMLSQEDVKIPAKGSTYSVNEGRYFDWHPETRHYIDYLRTRDKKTGRPYSARYVGSFVADFHRTLTYGGVFLYPADTSNPKRPHGKLRLLYEANPMAFIAEQAGGRASTGRERILDIMPTELHQRVPLIIGSPDDVDTAERFARGDVKPLNRRRSHD